MQSRPIRFAVLAALVVAMAPIASAQPPTLFYPDFSSTTGMVLNGSAAQAGNALRLTPALGGQAGTAWYQNPVTVAAGFSSNFAFQITPTGGADGMTFIIHNDAAGTAALAASGGSLGWTSEPLNPALTLINLLVIEIDNYQNGNFGDPNDNHISVHLVPTLPTTTNGADEFYSIAQATPPFNLDDGNIHTMCVDYVPGTLTITLDNAATPLISVPFDFATGGTSINGVPLAGLMLQNLTDAYVGFSGGTGGLVQNNDVLAWTFGPPGCAPLVGPWQTNSASVSLDVDGVQASPYSAAVSTNCVGSTMTLNSNAPMGALSDIAVTFTNSVPAAITTPGVQQVNIDVFHPSFLNFNGGAPNFGGILNLVPHPGTITFPIPTGAPLTGSAQQLTVDMTHPDGFVLSQAAEANVAAAAGPQTITLGDDATVQVILNGAPYCANAGVPFYGTTYMDLWVNSNGDTSFTMGHTDFTATSGEWQTNMPRIGIQADLEPNNYGTVTVANNGFAGLGDWITVSYSNVTEWGTTGMGVTSYNIELNGPNGHEIAGFTTDGTWGTTAVVGGISLGLGGTHPSLVSFDAQNGLGLQANANSTDSVIDENTAGMLLNTSGWVSIGFPLLDGSAYIVQ